MVDFIAEEDLPRFLNSVLDRAETLCQHPNPDLSDVQAHVVAVDEALGLIRTCGLVAANGDKEDWQLLSETFSNLLSSLQTCERRLGVSPSTVAENPSETARETAGPGRPPFQISAEMLEDLLSLGFTQQKLAQMFGVSRWTIARRIQQYNLQNYCGFTDMSDDELDSFVKDYIDRHGTATGQAYFVGYFKSLGLRVQRSRIRRSLTRLDPMNTALRWGVLVSRRVYYVPWPNSLWHLDGHHSLIRWKLVVHGCIDGFSRRTTKTKKQRE